MRPLEISNTKLSLNAWAHILALTLSASLRLCIFALSFSKLAFSRNHSRPIGETNLTEELRDRFEIAKQKVHSIRVYL